MPRIQSENSNAELEKKLSRMEDQIKKSRRRVFSCFNCLVYFIILAIIFIGAIAYFLAKSGLVQVPVLTNSFFHKPEPSYLVTPVEPSTLEKKLVDQILAKAAPDFAVGKDVSVVTLTFSEAYLTGALHDAITNKPDSKIETVQIAAIDESLEFFVHRQENTYLLLTFIPEFVDGELKPNVQSVKLGNVTLPSGLGNMMLKLLISDSLKNMNRIFGAFGEIQDVVVVDGGISVTFRVSKKSQLFNVF